MKRPKFANFSAFYTVVSKEYFKIALIMDTPLVETLLALAEKF